jgi:uncharacterized protein YggU (UPF0235/DUF167 family)
VTDSEAVNLTSGKGGVLIPVRVTLRGRQNGITGVRGGVLLVSVTAPPAEGEANAAVIDVLRAALHCPKGALSLWRGDKSRDKVIAVTVLELNEVKARLEMATPRRGTP